MANVYIYKCDNYEPEAIKNTISKIIDSFDCIKNIKPNSRVVIKANLVSAMDPKKGATTHPAILKELTEYFLHKKCTVIIGDSPGGVFTKTYLAHIYSATKMNETGAKLNDDFGTKKVLYNDALVLKSFEYTLYLDKADLLINVCKLKTHGMMNLSCSVKNLFGIIPGTLKPEYHYRFPNHKDFANMLIDINEYFKFDVNIVDAIIGMEGNGPTMGTPKKIGCVLASSNPYALDYISSQIIGVKPEDVETINCSKERNLFKPEDIKTNVDINDLVIKDFKVINGRNSIMFYSNEGSFFSKLIAKCSNYIFSNKPMLHKKKCIGCGKCANICPAKAITIVNKKAVIDRDKCIKCYCCQEFCPIGAMGVKSSLIIRMLHRKKHNNK